MSLSIRKVLIPNGGRPPRGTGTTEYLLRSTSIYFSSLLHPVHPNQSISIHSIQMRLAPLCFPISSCLGIRPPYSRARKRSQTSSVLPRYSCSRCMYWKVLQVTRTSPHGCGWRSYPIGQGAGVPRLGPSRAERSSGFTCPRTSTRTLHSEARTTGGDDIRHGGDPS